MYRIAILLVLVFVKTAYADPEIQVLKFVKIETQGSIFLGDVAKYKDIDPEVISMLNKIEIASFAGNGHKIITGFQISKILRKAIPPFEEHLQKKILVKVPAIVKIEAQVFKIDPTTVALMIESEFKKICIDCTYQLSNIQIPQLNGVSKNSKWNLEYQGLKLPRGAFSIPLRISEKTYWVSGTVKIFKKVPVAARNLSIGERLSEGDFNFEIKDVTMIQDTTPTVEKLFGRQLSRGLLANEIIIHSALAKELAVKYGQSVKVLTDSDWVQITMHGVAQERGEIGDRIRVMNPTTKTMITAVIEAPGVVRVE